MKSVEQRLADINPEFMREVQQLSPEQLDRRLSQLAKDAEAVQQAQEADETLQQAKAELKELNAPYREGKVAIKLKTRYVIHRINENT